MNLKELIEIVDAYIRRCNVHGALGLTGLHHEEKAAYKRVIIAPTVRAILTELQSVKATLDYCQTDRANITEKLAVALETVERQGKRIEEFRCCANCDHYADDYGEMKCFKGDTVSFGPDDSCDDWKPKEPK